MDPVYYLRNPTVSLMARKEHLVCFPGNGTVARAIWLGERLAALQSLISVLRVPRCLQELTEESRIDGSRVAELVRLLMEHQIVVSGSMEQMWSILKPPSRDKSMDPICRSIVVGVTGSIYATRSLSVIAMIRDTFAAKVDVILSKGAQKFVIPRTIEYCGCQVWTDPYSVRDGIKVPHMHLAASADLVLVLPASAAAIHRLANGTCSDLLSLVVAATSAPVVVAPAMNSRMASYAPIARNIDCLRSAGLYVIEPGIGREASSSEMEMSFSGVGAKDSTLLQMLAYVIKSHRNTAPARAPATPRIEDEADRPLPRGKLNSMDGVSSEEDASCVVDSEGRTRHEELHLACPAT